MQWLTQKIKTVIILKKNKRVPLVNVETEKSTSVVADEVHDESRVSSGSSKLDFEGI